VATLRGLDATVGVEVGRGHVVGARGCQAGGERGSVGAQVQGGDLERDREWTGDEDYRGGGPLWIGNGPVSRIRNVQVVEIGRRGTGGQGQGRE
jgi:hypothetical protein